MKKNFSVKNFGFVVVSLVLSVSCGTLYANEESSARGQFPQAEVVNPENPSNIDFPKAQNPKDEILAKKFAWWPTDSKPAPFKDPDQSGYWWWPEVPGEMRPWGNRGYIYVTKIIFDYNESSKSVESTAGEMRPSLVVKKVLMNVKVYFDYDKSELREDAINTLNQAIGVLQRNSKADILITGNADIRGSEPYNLKLGEGRASSVKSYLLDNGVAEERVRILSRGKLDAIAPANDIVGMQKDRNAQFMVAEVEEVMIPASQASLYADPSSQSQQPIQAQGLSAHIQPDQIIEETKSFEGDIKVDFKEYVIQKGDTLWAIAEREYGRGTQWKRIYEFNKDVISNPDRPRKGTTIRIPIE